MSAEKLNDGLDGIENCEGLRGLPEHLLKFVIQKEVKLQGVDIDEDAVDEGISRIRQAKEKTEVVQPNDKKDNLAKESADKSKEEQRTSSIESDAEKKPAKDKVVSSVGAEKPAKNFSPTITKPAEAPSRSYRLEVPADESIIKGAIDTPEIKELTGNLLDSIKSPTTFTEVSHKENSPVLEVASEISQPPIELIDEAHEDTIVDFATEPDEQTEAFQPIFFGDEHANPGSPQQRREVLVDHEVIEPTPIVEYEPTNLTEAETKELTTELNEIFSTDTAMSAEPEIVVSAEETTLNQEVNQQTKISEIISELLTEVIKSPEKSAVATQVIEEINAQLETEEPEITKELIVALFELFDDKAEIIEFIKIVKEFAKFNQSVDFLKLLKIEFLPLEKQIDNQHYLLNNLQKQYYSGQVDDKVSDWLGRVVIYKFSPNQLAA